MKIIKDEKLNVNILYPEEGYMLHEINEVLEQDDQEPYLTDSAWLASSITTIEQCEKIWEEIKVKEDEE